MNQRLRQSPANLGTPSSLPPAPCCQIRPIEILRPPTQSGCRCHSGWPTEAGNTLLASLLLPRPTHSLGYSSLRRVGISLGATNKISPLLLSFQSFYARIARPTKPNPAPPSTRCFSAPAHPTNAFLSGTFRA
ncbi:hypothetical protein QCA50_006908 [Cerrena zonata]|uniref:Uncharacterized protein n=1 Tax=Cerrena zonata TaxID=2478898 RepID=A0AAW0G9Z0_9APHY